MLLLVAFWWCWRGTQLMLPTLSWTRGCFSWWGKSRVYIQFAKQTLSHLFWHAGCFENRLGDLCNVKKAQRHLRCLVAFYWFITIVHLSYWNLERGMLHRDLRAWSGSGFLLPLFNWRKLAMIPATGHVNTHCLDYPFVLISSAFCEKCRGCFFLFIFGRAGVTLGGL